MTDVVYTHSFDTDDTSSVIDTVYYSEPEKLLFVELVSGTLAGYQDVPLNVYTALETINSNRIIDGNEASSVGRYWNMWVKPHFPGYDTSEVDLLSEEDVRRQEKLRDLVNRADVIFDRTPIEAKSFYIAPIEQELERYGVTVWDEDEEVNLTVWATDIDDAVDRYRQAEKILGWDEAEIISAIKFFN